jgi:hypothetical protein
MRKLRYTVELPDGSHEDHAAIGFGDAETLVRSMDWSPVPGLPPAAPDEDEPRLPFLLFLDEGESFFMFMPEEAGVRVVTRVLDKWGLLGIVTREKSFTLEFGLLTREDSLVLLKLFFEDNYPALRALEKEMQSRPGA